VRIVAGTARGRTLTGPRSQGIRPTADRVRESLFNSLGQWMDGLRVLDLFAGTGALALEAISRGAQSAVLVDPGAEAAALCRRNAEALGFLPQVEIWKVPALSAIPKLAQAQRQFELVFADPPYDQEAVGEVLAALEGASLLTPGGVFCAEHRKTESPPEKVGELVRFDQRKFGDTVASLYRRGDP
jgi:16S rRNA (guanine(966)-N(2))-methyltransferase RsmD